MIMNYSSFCIAKGPWLRYKRVCGRRQICYSTFSDESLHQSGKENHLLFSPILVAVEIFSQAVVRPYCLPSKAQNPSALNPLFSFRAISFSGADIKRIVATTSRVSLLYDGWAIGHMVTLNNEGSRTRLWILV